MKKIRSVFLMIYTVGALVLSTASFSEDGNPPDWNLVCYHHGDFIGVSMNMMGCVVQVPEEDRVPLPHGGDDLRAHQSNDLSKSKGNMMRNQVQTHTNILDCVHTDPFN